MRITGTALTLILVSAVSFDAAAAGKIEVRPPVAPDSIIWSAPRTYSAREKGNPTNYLELMARFKSEENIRAMSQIGVTALRTVFYRGFGLQAEKEDIDSIKDVVRLMHKYGIKHTCYTQWASLMYETFFAEEPRAQDWIQVDYMGQPVTMGYGFGTYRYHPCFNHAEYVDYLKRVIDVALDEVKTDAIMWDNVAENNPEPESCQCPVCVRMFRQFIKDRYPGELLKKRYGFTNLDYVIPPRFNREDPASELVSITDPLMQDWASFRCWTLSRAFREMNAYIRSKRPGMLIDVNPHGIIGSNRAWATGIDLPELLDGEYVDSFGDEIGRQTGIMPDGVLFSKIRNYKISWTLNVSYHEYYNDDALTFAVNMAFNPQKFVKDYGWAGEPHLGWGAGGMDERAGPELRDFLNFCIETNGHLQAAEHIADVAVLRSYASMAYDNQASQFHTNLIEQAFIQARVPFDIIFDKQLKDLSRYKVLVLGNQMCLSDEQCGTIADFVKKGGGLVATGASSAFNEWYWPRPNFALRDLLAADYRGRQAGDTRNLIVETSQSVYNLYGAGRAVYIPEVVSAQPARPGNPDLYILPPANSEEIVNAVRWAAGGRFSCEVMAPPTTVAEYRYNPGTGEIVIGMVNCALDDPVSSIVVEVVPPGGKKITGASVLSHEWKGAPKLDVKMENGVARIVVPRLELYNLVLIKLG